MRTFTSILVTSLMLSLLYLSSCKKKEDLPVMTGSIKLENLSSTKIYPMAKGKQTHSVGYVGTNSFAVMGFANFSLDDDVRVQWIEGHIDNPEKVVHFDISALKEIISQIKALEFSYQGENVWHLRVYSQDPSTEESFLKKIICEPYDGEIGEPRDWTR